MNFLKKFKLNKNCLLKNIINNVVMSHRVTIETSWGPRLNDNRRERSNLRNLNQKINFKTRRIYNESDIWQRVKIPEWTTREDVRPVKKIFSQVTRISGKNNKFFLKSWSDHLTFIPLFK